MTFFICGHILRHVNVFYCQNNGSQWSPKLFSCQQNKEIWQSKENIQVCTDIRVSKCVNDKFVIFEWTIPLSTKWNNLSNCAILSVPLVPIQLWGETGYLVHLVGLFIKMSSTRGPRLTVVLNLLFPSVWDVPATLSLSHCPGPVTEPGQREWAHFVATQQAQTHLFCSTNCHA